MQKNPDDVIHLEKTAAKSEMPIERTVLRGQARQARASGCLMPKKRMSKRKLLKYLCEDGSFTEHRAVWSEELQRHCKEGYDDDEEETILQQEERNEKCRREGHRQFTEEGTIAEITVDLFLRARARMAEERVNGPEDSVVTEMTKQHPQEKMFEITKVPPGFKRAIALTLVMSKWSTGKRKQPEELEQKHVAPTLRAPLFLGLGPTP